MEKVTFCQCLIFAFMKHKFLGAIFFIKCQGNVCTFKMYFLILAHFCEKATFLPCQKNLISDDKTHWPCLTTWSLQYIITRKPSKLMCALLKWMISRTWSKLGWLKIFEGCEPDLRIRGWIIQICYQLQ